MTVPWLCLDYAVATAIINPTTLATLFCLVDFEALPNIPASASPSSVQLRQLGHPSHIIPGTRPHYVMPH